MLYNKPLQKCSCGKYPKLEKIPNYAKYICEECNLQTFFSKTPQTAKELWNSQIDNIEKLKVRI